MLTAQTGNAFETSNTMVGINKLIIEQRKETKPDDILVCLDVDLTLTASSDPAVQWPNIERYKLPLRSILKTLNPREYTYALNLSTKTKPSVLIEPEAPEIVRHLIRSGVHVIALTDSMTGKLGPLKSVADWRAEELRHLGFNFKDSFKDIPDFQLSSAFPKSKRQPLFKEGLLFVDGNAAAMTKSAATDTNTPNKGSVLVAFLKKLNYKPQIVILADDRPEYLEMVEKSLKAYDPSIKFIGIHYTGGHTFSTGDISEEEFVKFYKDIAEKAKMLTLQESKVQ